MSAHLDPWKEQIRLALIGRAEELFELAFGPPERRGGKEWRPKSNPSLAMAVKGQNRGRWHDHADDSAKGDVFDLVALGLCGLSCARDDFRRVIEEAARFCGMGEGPALVDRAAIEKRQRERQEAEKREAAEEAAKKADTTARVAAASCPVEGTAAQTYLRSRCITELPPLGLSYAEPLPPFSKGILHPQYRALVVWAYDDAGNVRGGQRILVHEDGSKAHEDERKPSFAATSGYPARFPGKIEDGPLVVAEGPESALSIWQATGFETWAVFGVSGWKAAPLPKGRKVILCPDRDAKGSPAAQSFDRAAARHVRAGCNIWIAKPPEPEGSKHDLNDTHQRAGLKAVREAIEAAEPICPPSGKPPTGGGDRDAQIARIAAKARSWARGSLRMAQARKALAEAYDLRLPETEAEKKAIRQEVRATYGLDKLPRLSWGKSFGGSRWLISGAQGIGKTAVFVGRKGEAGELHLGAGIVTAFYSPDHEKTSENFGRYMANKPATGIFPAAFQVRGRSAPHPQDPTKERRMCEIWEVAEKAAKRGVNVRKTLCEHCPLAASCAYMAQENQIKEAAQDPRGLVLFLPHDYAALNLPGGVTPDRYVFDEEPRDRFLRQAVIPLDAWGQDLRGFLRWAEMSAGEAADKLEALLSRINPLRTAVMRALTEHPATALAVIRQRALEIAPHAEPHGLFRLAAKELKDFTDDRLEGHVSGEMQGYAMAREAGSPTASLETRIERALDEAGERHTRDLIAVFEAVARDLESGAGEAMTGVHRATINGRDCIAAEYLAPLTIPRRAPLLHLDGTANHDLAKAYFGGELERFHYPVERLGSATYIAGHGFSNSGLTGYVKTLWGEHIPRNPERAEVVRRKIAAGIALRPDFGLVMPKDALALLGDVGPRPTLHFGALRGSNAIEPAPGIYVFGRPLPRHTELERMARAFASALGRTLETLPHGSRGYPLRLQNLRTRDGKGMPVEVAYHPDPTAQALLEQIRDAEVTQAIDRARAQFEAKEIIFGGSCIPDVTVDRIEDFEAWAQGGTRVQRAIAARNVLPLSESEAEAFFPDLWKSRKAARKDQSLQDVIALSDPERLTGPFGIKNILNTVGASQRQAVLCSYRKAPTGGRGGSRRTLKAVVFGVYSLEQARTVLEQITGPLADLRIDDMSAAAIEADAMAERAAIQAESLSGIKEAAAPTDLGRPQRPPEPTGIPSPRQAVSGQAPPTPKLARAGPG